MSHCIIVGCDQHSASLAICIGIDKEKPRYSTFGNTPRERKRLIHTLLAMADKLGAKPQDIYFAYEASRFGFGLYDDLSAMGINCHVLACVRIPRSLSAMLNKTDQKDARSIFELLRGAVLAGNDLPVVWVPGRQLRDEREITRARLDVVDKLKRTKNQIVGMLARFEIGKPGNVRRNWTASHRKWLFRLAEGQEGALGRWTRQSLRRLLDELLFYQAQCKKLDKQIRELAGTIRYEKAVERVCKIKGVGIITAMTFLAELGDLNRFSNRKQIGAYLGLVPATYESGQADDRKGHITRQGPSRVRGVLCQAVWVWIRWDQRARRIYHNQLCNNGGHRKKAAVAMMRRLAILMWHAAREGLHSWTA
jgi:transposase